MKSEIIFEFCFDETKINMKKRKFSADNLWKS